MDIHLKDSDISQMPEALRHDFLEWIPGHLAKAPSEISMGQKTGEPEAISTPTQLPLPLNFNSQYSEQRDNCHVRLSQLMDAGITKSGMSVRVRYTRDLAKKLGRDYINSLVISPKGTIIYEGEEYDKPSPLAIKVNGGGSLNGWDYIQVKKNGEWVDLKELRNIWRESNGSR